MGSDDVVIVGVGVGAETVAVAPALFVVSAALVTVTVTLAGEGTVAGAEYSPLEDTVPTVEFPPVIPFTLQDTAVLEVPPTVAVNCCIWETITEALAGDTVTETAGKIVALASPL